MNHPEIKSLEGIWTEVQVESLKNWLQSASGMQEIKTSQENILNESKIIEKMAIVDVTELKKPLTFSI